LVLAFSLISWPYYFGFSVLYCALSLWLVSVYLRDSKSKDPKEVVADEVMGVLISFFLVPISWFTLILGFLLFRFFDIFKPPPISFFDKKVPGAAGVMGDDIVAGIIVNIIFHFIFLDPEFMTTIQVWFGSYLGF
jgi:phosphatidylglycerophosphatase A